MSTDPVCGMEIYETKAAATAFYKGTAYHFCSKKCLGVFEENPATYVVEAA